MHNLFEGRSIRLRALESGDAETLYHHLHDTEISRRDARIQWPRCLTEIRSSLEKQSEVSSRDNKELAIETLDGQLVGGIDIQMTDARNGTFSIGIGLTDRSVWGKGYAKEAMLLVLRFMYHERRYQKCNIGLYAFNQRALGLYQRLGFQTEGRIRRNYFSGGTYNDEILLGMTREEFDARYPEMLILTDGAEDKVA